MINKQNMNEKNDSINLGSLCQLIRVKKLYLACNQYYNHYTDIKSGVKIVERHDCRSASWDNFNSEYCNSNDTFVTAYCRKTDVFEYEDTDFPDESYQDTEYIIMRITDINDEYYSECCYAEIEQEREFERADEESVEGLL